MPFGVHASSVLLTLLYLVYFPFDSISYLAHFVCFFPCMFVSPTPTPPPDMRLYHAHVDVLAELGIVASYMHVRVRYGLRIWFFGTIED